MLQFGSNIIPTLLRRCCNRSVTLFHFLATFLPHCEIVGPTLQYSCYLFILLFFLFFYSNSATLFYCSCNFHSHFNSNLPIFALWLCFCSNLLSTTSSSTISMASSKSPTSIWTGFTPTPVSCVTGIGQIRKSDGSFQGFFFRNGATGPIGRMLLLTCSLHPAKPGQRAGSRHNIIPSNKRAAGSTCGQNTSYLRVFFSTAWLKLPAVGSLVPPDFCSRKP